MNTKYLQYQAIDRLFEAVKEPAVMEAYYAGYEAAQQLRERKRTEKLNKYKVVYCRRLQGENHDNL